LEVVPEILPEFKSVHLPSGMFSRIYILIVESRPHDSAKNIKDFEVKVMQLG